MDPRNNIATDLFYKIRSRFSNLKLGSETGQITIIPEEARFFDFDYTEEEKAIGHVSISLAEPNSMKVYFSAGITESMGASQKNKWYGFLKELRLFAKKRLMSFDTRDIAKDNLDKRDYQFLSQANKPTNNTQSPVGESVMNESAMYGSRTMSYQKLMDTRLIIKHSQAVMDDTQPGARTRHISALFVENQDGERFKYPFIHLAGARAMQRHVANGGLPYDEIGASIIQMSEEIAQLKSFSNYVVRNDLMNSDNNDIVEKGQSQLNKLRETIAKLSKQSHYNSYKESFQARQSYDIPEEVAEDFVDKFTVKNFKEDIKSVFPVLYRLMKEQEQELGYNDIVENDLEINTDDDEITEYDDPMAAFERWAMQLGEESGITSEDVETQNQAIQQLQELIGEHFPAGVDGTNAIESLKGIIEDPALYKEIKETAKQDPDTCVRPLVKGWLEQHAPEVIEQLDFGDMVDEPAAAQGGDITAPEGEPQMAADDPDERNEKDDEPPFDADDDVSDKDEFGNTIKHKAKHLAKKGMRQAMDVKELAEFINTFYDRNTGTFPKGPEGVCTMVGKKFGEQAEMVARKFVERMAPHQEQGAEELEELGRMRELAGLKTEGDIDIKDVPQFKDYGPGPNPELEDKLTKILKRFEDSALERYHYGDVSDKLIQKVAALITQGETDDAVQAVSDVFGDKDGDSPDRIDDLFEYLRDEFEELADMFAEGVNTESGVSESQDDTYTITNPDLERDAETGREEPDQIEVKVEFSSYVDEFEIDKVVRVDTGEDITDKVLKDRDLHFSLVHDVQQREQEKADRDYSEDSGEELARIRKLSGIAQGLGY